MKYMILNGVVMARSRTQERGSWQVFSWPTGRWEPAPYMDLRLSERWRRLTAAEALQIAAGVQPDDHFGQAC